MGPLNINGIIYFLFIFLSICLIALSSTVLFYNYNIIKAVGIINKVTCVPNTTKDTLYKCELTIQYDTKETVLTVENNVKYEKNDSITIYYPDNNSSNVSLIDMNYKLLSIGGIMIGIVVFSGCIIGISIST